MYDLKNGYIIMAEYSAETDSGHLHLIKKLQSVLNLSLVKKIMLLDSPPTMITPVYAWSVHKAVEREGNLTLGTNNAILS